MTRPRNPGHDNGLTLVELMVTLAIVAILLAIAVPSMQQLIARKRVEGVANELASDIRYLRSVQSQRSRAVRIIFAANKTCYTMLVKGSSPTASCDCTQAALGLQVCTSGSSVHEEIKTVTVPSSDITLTAVPSSLEIAGSDGMPTAEVELSVNVSSSTGGGEVRVATNLAARPNLCSVSGHGSSMAAC